MMTLFQVRRSEMGDWRALQFTFLVLAVFRMGSSILRSSSYAY